MSVFTRFDGFEFVGGIEYRLKNPLVWEIGARGSGWLLFIPAGFVFESSVPRLLRWIVDPHDRRFLAAAAVHDHLLETGYRKAFAAGEWHDAAKAMNAPTWLRIPALFGVVLWTVR